MAVGGCVMAFQGAQSPEHSPGNKFKIRFSKETSDCYNENWIVTNCFVAL